MVEYYLKNIESQQHLNAFLEVWGEEAIERAKAIDEKVKAGTAGRLAGCVIALKDVLAFKDHRVGSSSKILEGFTSIYSATVVQRLLDEDAIFIGRTNCDEFAMGASNENSAFGPVLNAVDNTRVPGGSSGGSAVSVQAKMAHAALGTDTGGSIRQPVCMG
jgi:aspartyl-tRNA(Asn)/glutamyl-tRNA(Gln) amidotransferase subunit A